MRRSASSAKSASAPTRSKKDGGPRQPADLRFRWRTAELFPATFCTFRREFSLAQPFDLTTLSTRGEAVAVAEGVGRFFTMSSVGVSDNGTLIYRSAGTGQTRLAWVNRAGQTQETGASAGVYDEMALSPDDKRVAFARPGQSGTDVWLTDLDRRITSRFTFRPPLTTSRSGRRTASRLSLPRRVMDFLISIDVRRTPVARTNCSSN